MSQQSLRESMIKNNQNPKNQISVRAIATGYNKRGISSDSRQDQNRYNSNNNIDALSNLITQQVEYRPNTSSPMNNINVINPRSIVNSPRQNEHNRGSTVAPTNRIVAQNPKPVTGNRFLPNQSRDNVGKKTLILDLDETLVHSAFKPFSQRSDILLNVELDKKIHIIHVLKRPGAEEFIERMAKHYEVVIFTASLSAYANPLMDQLDSKRHCCYRLFREHCTSLNGVFVKDMSKLGRDLKDVIIVDNNPGSFSFHKENGIPIKTWYSDKSDRDLYNLIPILEALAYVNDVRDHLKKFCFNNEVNYKIAHGLAATLNAQTSQNRNQNQPQLDSDRILSPSKSHNYLSNSGSNFYPSSKANSNPSNPYNQQERSYFNQANHNKENAYGSRLGDSNNYNTKSNLTNKATSYVNNVMPVNKKIGLDGYATNLNVNSASALNSNINPSNFSKQNHNSAASDSPYNRKSILPANKFPNNEENLQQPENSFLNTPFNASGKLNNNNRSFNNYKPTLDEERVGTSDLNNPNISINIINHNYSHYYVNPEDEKKGLGPGHGEERDIKLNKYNTSAALRPNNLADKYNVSNHQNRPPLNNMNYNPMSLQNYPNNIRKDANANEKKNKYSNINLFRSGNPNMNNSFGNTNNNGNANNNNNLNSNNNSNSYLNRQYPDNRGNLSKNPANLNKNANFESFRGADLNNLDKRLLQNPKQQAHPQRQDRENSNFPVSNNSENYYNNNINPTSNLNRYNSFLSDKYSSKLSSNGRPSSAVLVGQSNPNHLSRYPISSQQIQSFFNNNSASNSGNNNNYNNNLGAYSKEKNFTNTNNGIKNNINYNNSLQPKIPNNNGNFGLTTIDRKNPQFREHSANPSLRSFNSANFAAGNNYINQNYYQMSNSNNNTNLINNPQKQKFGNNLTSSVNNFDMDLTKNIGNRTSRPGTSLNENKGITRDFSLGTPKRPINVNSPNTININNNNPNSQGTSFLHPNNPNNPRSPNSNYGMINKSFNALTAKDLVYEEFNSNRESLMNKNYSGNNNPNMAISRSVERSKFKPSTPNYQTSNNYFSQNRQSGANNNINSKNNNYHQKQNSENNYSSLIHNFPVYTNEQKSLMNRNVNTPTAHNYRSTPVNNYQNYQNQSNNFGLNKPNQNRGYEYYYNHNNNPSAKFENKAVEQTSNFSQSMRERFYPIGGNI